MIAQKALKSQDRVIKLPYLHTQQSQASIQLLVIRVILSRTTRGFLSDGSFGIWVECRPDEQETVRRVLKEKGAEEVRGDR